MKVGDLVRATFNPSYIGIITEMEPVRNFQTKVMWNDGDHSWILSKKLEVICK